MAPRRDHGSCKDHQPYHGSCRDRLKMKPLLCRRLRPVGHQHPKSASFSTASEPTPALVDQLTVGTKTTSALVKQQLQCFVHQTTRIGQDPNMSCWDQPPIPKTWSSFQVCLKFQGTGIVAIAVSIRTSTQSGHTLFVIRLSKGQHIKMALDMIKELWGNPMYPDFEI